jgi:hypothetical protein
MNYLLTVMALTLACVTAFPHVQADEPSGLIQVKVTGLLNTSALKISGKNKTTFTGSVFAQGRELALDCTANRAAEKLLREAHVQILGDPDVPHPVSWVVPKKVEVRGRLEFRPCLKFDAKGNRFEQADPLLVIVVDSLKIVE